MSAGVPVTIVTGRLYSGTKDAADACRIGGPLACVDGSHIVDNTSGAKLLYKSIAGANAIAMRAILERHQTACFVFARDEIIHDEGGAEFAPYVRTWSNRVQVVSHVIGHGSWEHEEGVIAVVAVGPPDHIEAASNELRVALAGVAYVVSFPVTRLDKMHALVVRAAGTNKGTALEFIAKHHGVSMVEVVAVGDWLNDIPMFQVAGRSFVMAQAPRAVKAYASDCLIAEASSGGGIAEAIDKAFFERD